MYGHCQTEMHGLGRQFGRAACREFILERVWISLGSRKNIGRRVSLIHHLHVCSLQDWESLCSVYGYIWVYVDSVAFVDAEELFKVCGGADTLFLTHYSARRTGLGWPRLYLIKSSCNLRTSSLQRFLRERE